MRTGALPGRMSEVPPTRIPSRFRPSPGPEDPVYSDVPDDGLCLNVFLLVADAADAGRVLLGRLDPAAPWKKIGGMSEARIRSTTGRWMLPSRQLFRFEAPDDAARSILREQLELPAIPVAGPSVTSEAWQRPQPVGTGLHWDLSFLYRATWPAGQEVRATPWQELAFLDPRKLQPKDVGRSHLDVLALAGFPVPP